MQKLIHKYVLPIGLICLALGLIINRFFNGSEALDFFSGLLFGLSIVFNLFGLVQYRREQQEQQQKNHPV